MAKLFCIVNAVHNVMYRKKAFEAVCQAKYREVARDFVINIMQNVIKLHRNGL